MEAVPFNNAQTALQFMLAGNARVTIKSTKTGARYTYRIHLNEEEAEKPAHQQSWFVYILNGPDNTKDFSYLGMIRRHQFFVTRATKHMETAPFARGLDYVFRHLRNNHLPPHAELWHESTCGRCGRALTVPESIRTGIGPECAKRIGRN